MWARDGTINNVTYYVSPSKNWSFETNSLLRLREGNMEPHLVM